MNSKQNSLNDKRKIWIDLDNSPHVPFFYPIASVLENKGYEVIFTIRDCFQVKGLADYFHLNYRKIGKHYGSNIIMKIAGTLLRSFQMAPLIIQKKPILSISHGSRSLIILSTNLLSFLE